MHKSKQKIIKWARQFRSVNRWLDTVLTEGTASENTEYLYAKYVKIYCDMLNLNPDELILQRKQEVKSEDVDVAHESEERLKQIYLKILREEKKKGKAVLLVRIIKSFYEHNFLPLKIKDPKVAFATRTAITHDDFKLVYQAANPMLKSWLCILKDSGLSCGDALRLKYEQVQKDFEKGEQFILIRVIREKTQVKFNTFLGPNAIDALKLYFRELKVKGFEVNSETPLMNNKGKAVSYDLLGVYFRRLGRKYNVKLSAHKIRKFFETSMAFGKVHPLILKFWMGHKIGSDIESHYIPLIENIKEQLTLYKEAYKNIDLTGKTLEEKVREEAKKQIEEMLPPEVKELMETYHVKLRLKKKAREAAKITKKEDCPDGEHCGEEFKQINETELLSYLRQGWQIVHNLQNGEVVVKR